MQELLFQGGKGNADDKIEKMKSCGILIAESPAEIGKTLYDMNLQDSFINFIIR